MNKSIDIYTSFLLLKSKYSIAYLSDILYSPLPKALVPVLAGNLDGLQNRTTGPHRYAAFLDGALSVCNLMIFGLI